jgi:Uma2 family endonuclease
MTLAARSHSHEAADVELHSGDRMTQQEFHRLYELTPEGFRAELIGGIVYVASPLKLRHGRNHLPLGAAFFLYEGNTPGVETGDNVTVKLGADSEVQPDLFMRILPEYGGQSSTTNDDYVLGAPELVAEIAHTSQSIDLHGKQADYAKYGVLEYLVVSLIEKKLRWFDLAAGRELFPDADHVYRMRTFPGLWIDSVALLERNSGRLFDTLQKGLATPEHAEFVKKLSGRSGGKRR